VEDSIITCKRLHCFALSGAQEVFAVVKDNVILLEKGVKLPEGIEVGVITQGWWAVGKSSVQ